MNANLLFIRKTFCLMNIRSSALRGTVGFQERRHGHTRLLQSTFLALKRHFTAKIDPCIGFLNGFTAVRKFRNAVYRIKVENPSHISKGVSKIIVDGSELDGNIAPIFEDGQEHTVKVVLTPDR